MRNDLRHFPLSVTANYKGKHTANCLYSISCMSTLTCTKPGWIKLTVNILLTSETWKKPKKQANQKQKKNKRTPPKAQKTKKKK